MRITTAAAAVALALGATTSGAASSWRDNFVRYDASKWTQVTEIEHCEDACVLDRVDHLSYGTGGLGLAMDQSPCNTSKTACCVGGKCADWAAGHVVTSASYLYGSFQTSARIAHAPSGGATPNNAFTCIGA